MAKTERLKSLVENFSGYVKVPQKWIVTKKLRDRIIHRLFNRGLRWMQLHECNGIPFELSTRTFKIETETDFAGILGYLVKPIDWSKKYVEQWRQCCTVDRNVGHYFNRNVDQTIESWQYFSSNREQHIYLGKAHHARTGFVGIPKKQRETKHHKQRTLVMLEDCNMDRAFGVPELSQPLEFSGGCGSELAKEHSAPRNAMPEAGVSWPENKL